MARKLSGVWARQILFTLTEHGAVRVLDALTTLVLIRALSAESFGLFSVYQSWVAMALLFFPSIEVVLFRDYSKLKREGSLAGELAIYRLFNYAKLAVLCVVIGALSLVSQDTSWTDRFALVTFAFALPFSQAFYSFMREPLRFEMRQHVVSLVSAAQRAVLLAALVLAARFYPGRVPLLAFGAVAVYVLAGFSWWWTSREFFAGAVLLPPRVVDRVKTAFFGTVIWIHLSGVVMQVIQSFDLFALNLAGVGFAEIGRYGVSLKAANFFQLLPIALASSFGVYLARNHDEHERREERRRMFAYVCGFVALSLVLLALALAADRAIISFLAKGKLDAVSMESAVAYFRWQVAGVLVLCASYPLTTYLNIRGKLSRIFLEAGLPWLVLSAIVYLWSARHGALMTAKANVFAGGISVVLHSWYYLRHHRKMV